MGGWSDQFQTLLIKKQTHTGARAAECFITKKLKTAVRSQFVKTSSAKKTVTQQLNKKTSAGAHTEKSSSCGAL